MHSVTGPDDATACEFRTAHDVTLAAARCACRPSYFSFAPDLPLNTLPIAQRIKGGLRFRLKTTAGLKFAQTRIDRLCFYLAGRDDAANKLLELCLATGLGVLVRPIGGRASDVTLLPPSAIRPVGFSDEEAFCPSSLRSFQGYRLLQEYFTFPQRYRFIELAGLAAALGQSKLSDTVSRLSDRIKTRGESSGSRLTPMGKVYAVANQKGGVGKTTTAVNLASCAAAGAGRRCSSTSTRSATRRSRSARPRPASLLLRMPDRRGLGGRGGAPGRSRQPLDGPRQPRSRRRRGRAAANRGLRAPPARPARPRAERFA